MEQVGSMCQWDRRYWMIVAAPTQTDFVTVGQWTLR